MISSCSQGKTTNSEQVEEEGDVAYFHLSVKGAEYVAIPAELAEEAEQLISDLQVLVFDDAGKLLTSSNYHYRTGGITVKSVSGEELTVYLIANVKATDPIFGLTDLLEEVETKSDLESMMLNVRGIDLLTIPSHLPSIGMKDHVTVHADTPSLVEVDMSYLFSRIDLAISNKLPTKEGTFRPLSVRVMNMPTKSYLIEREQDAVNHTQASDYYSTAASYSFNPNDFDNPTCWTLSFYTLENRSGKCVDHGGVNPTGETLEHHTRKSKTFYAPSNATYVLAEGLHTLPNGWTQLVTINIYLGEDYCNDYNVKRGINLLYTACVKDLKTVNTNISFSSFYAPRSNWGLTAKRY
ncbi:MAG: fimbrial protein [Phocaeicola sp.]